MKRRSQDSADGTTGKRQGRGAAAARRKAAAAGAPGTSPPDLLARIIEEIPYPVFWKDRRSVYLGCNPSFARLAGVESPADVAGRTDDDLAWRGSQADRCRDDDRRVMESGTPILEREETRRVGGGRDAVLLTTKAPLRDAAGLVVGVLGTCVGVTGRTELGARRHEAHEGEAAGRLAADLAREIGAPIRLLGENLAALRQAWPNLTSTYLQGVALLSFALRDGGPAPPATLRKLRNEIDGGDLDLIVKVVPQSIEQSLEGIERVGQLIRAMEEGAGRDRDGDAPAARAA